MKEYKDIIIFEDKTLSDLFKDIYTNSNDKKKQIDEFLEKMNPYITSINDIVNILPIIKEYLDSGIKNDDNLIKLAGIIQRSIARNQEDLLGAELFDENELSKIKEQAEQFEKNEKTIKMNGNK